MLQIMSQLCGCSVVFLPCALGSNPPVQITAASTARILKIAEVSVDLKTDLQLNSTFLLFFM